jgi:hypothetical protein
MTAVANELQNGTDKAQIFGPILGGSVVMLTPCQHRNSSRMTAVVNGLQNGNDKAQIFAPILCGSVVSMN